MNNYTSLPADPTFFPHYFEYVNKTEPPLIFHRWCALTSLGAMLGRQFWLPFGTGELFPNLYVMLIGNPGTRKTTAVLRSKKVVASAGYDHFAAEKTTKEKFLLDLAGVEEVPFWKAAASRKGSASALTGIDELLAEVAPDVVAAAKTPKEVFIVADEFNEFVGAGNLDFLSMLGVFWDWNEQDRPYKSRVKNSQSVEIYQPTVSILSGNTHASFQAAFPPQAVGQGFLSRLLLIYGDKPRAKYPFPEKPSEHLTKLLVERFAHIRKEVKGPATIHPKAHDALSQIYMTWPEMEDHRFQYYSSRRHTHLLKLCLVFAAARCSTTITEFDVLYANTCLTYTESLMPKALGEFGKSRDSEASTKLMQALYDAKAPLPPDVVMRLLAHDVEGPKELQALLQKLQSANRIQYVQGRGWLACQRPLDSKRLYVNYKLLTEMPVELGGRGDVAMNNA